LTQDKRRPSGISLGEGSETLAIFETWRQGIAIRQGRRFTFANQAFATACGYESPQQILALDSAMALVDESERGRTSQYYAARHSGADAPFFYTLRARRKDGSSWWAENRVEEILWNGEPAVLIAINDISERHEDEERHLRDQDRFRTMLEGSKLPVIIRQMDRIVFANQAFTRLFGYDSPDEIYALASINELAAPEDRNRLRSIIGGEDWGHDRIEQYEFRARRKDGSTFWLECRMQYVHWQGEDAALAFVGDISERKLADKRLREDEQNFRALVENSVQGIVVHRHANPLYANDAVARLVGLERASEVTSLDSLAEFFLPEDVERFREYGERRLRGEAAPSQYEHRIRRIDGSVGWSEARQTVVDWEGEPAILSTVQDITARKDAEAELRLLNERLEQRVEDRTRELEEANQAKSDFLSAMSHELRTPLNAILGFVQLLRDYPDQPLTEEQGTHIEQILAGGRHLLGLVNEILDLSRIEAGRLDLELAPIDPAKTVRECLAMVKPLADKRGIAISADPGVDAGPLVLADAARLKQIVLNILSNAVKYNRDGGEVLIDGGAGRTGMLKLSVADTGVGIPMELRDQVFQPFSRLTRHSSGVEGTGIGLTISRQLAIFMGGSLEFESTPGEGSTFWIELPIAKA
jgi:PAS domain S-box-containing protein